MSGIIGLSPNMKSGVLGKYPDGHVIQVCSNSDDTTVTNTGASEVVCACFCDITIKSSTSTLMILASCEFYQDSTPWVVHYNIKQKSGAGHDIDPAAYTQIKPFSRAAGQDGDEGFYTVPLQVHWTHGQSVGATHNIAVTQTIQSSGTVHNNNSSAFSVMSIYEVEGTVTG